MTRDEYLEIAITLYDEGKISPDAYDALLTSIDELIEEEKRHE